MCPGCLARKGQIKPDLRVDTLKGHLVCSLCHSGDVLAVDLLGRVGFVGEENYVLCPGCCTVHALRAGETGWVQGCWAKKAKAVCGGKGACGVCDEPCLPAPLRLVDLGTGVMESFFLCSKHTPREVVWANARRFEEAWVCKRGFRALPKK